MRRSIALAVFAIVMSYPAVAPAFPQDASPADTARIAALEETLRTGFTKIENDQFADAVTLLKSAMADPSFGDLPADYSHLTYYSLGLAELKTGDAQSALAALKTATQSSLADEGEWSLRLHAAYALHDYDDSTGSLTVIATRWPQSLSDFSDYAIFRLTRQASTISDDAAIALIEPMHAAKWQPSDKFLTADGAWTELARAYLARGNVTAAASALNDVKDAGVLVRIRSEKIFDSVVALNPDHFDVAVALRNEIDNSKALAAASPDKLEGIVSLSDILIKANRPEEALAVLDVAIKRATPADGSASPFKDNDNNLNWALNNRARALYFLGRYQEQVDVLASAARMMEGGSQNVSQVINLGDAYNSLGRPKDALDMVTALDRASDASPYGRMALAHTEACAHAQLDDQANLGTKLDYLRAHAADGPPMLLDGLICANDSKGAAALLIAQLQAPATRADTLFMLQDFLKPLHATPIDEDSERKLLALRDLPEVSAAISASGRVASYPILPPDY